MNEMICKEINVNKFSYKNLTTTNFDFRSITLLFTTDKCCWCWPSRLTCDTTS